MQDYKYSSQDWLRLWWDTRVRNGLTRHDLVWLPVIGLGLFLLWWMFPGWDFAWGKH